MQKRLHAIVYGRVQGVFFRDFARRHARALGLTGFVRNAEDGTVEVVAEGEEVVLTPFLAFLRKGPLFAKVENVAEVWGEAEGTFSDFRILES